MSAQIVANDPGDAFLECPRRGLIESKEDFYKLSEYAPGNRKHSLHIFNEELGNRSRYRGVQKTYHGDKTAILQRIAHNKCTVFPKQRYWHKYNDFASPSEAFIKADQMFGGRLEEPTALQLQRSIAPAPGQRPHTSSQLLPEDQYRRMRDRLASQASEIKARQAIAAATAAALRVEQKVGYERKRAGPAAAAPVEVPGTVREVGTGKRYVPFARDTRVLFECPFDDGKAAAAPSEAQVKQRLEQYRDQMRAQGVDVRGKTVYCGRQLTDLLQGKICGTLPGWPRVDGVDLEEIGSPGRCFAYGKYRFTNALGAAYSYYAIDPDQVLSAKGQQAIVGSYFVC